jgi:16S rRNA (adenine1518-N6/adenine1519-N6)-dimethyltransferase
MVFSRAYKGGHSMRENPRRLIERYGLHPRRSLGQNFLVDPTAPDRIAGYAHLDHEDTVVEVGAGLGTLTAALAGRAGRVIAVETDPELVAVLHLELDRDDVDIVEGDILTLDPVRLLGIEPLSGGRPLWGHLLPHYKVVANLPYYITSAAIRHLFEADVRPKCMVLTVQYEVAKRMTAEPGDMSLLAVSVQFYSEPTICMKLGQNAFYPPPNINSGVVRFDLREEPPFPCEDVPTFFRIVKAGFAQRRKQLRNTLSGTLDLDRDAVAARLDAVGVSHKRRAETLSMDEWGRVYEALAPMLSRSQ